MSDLRDKIAQALDIEGAFCGTCDREPGDSPCCKACVRVLNGYADAVLAVLDLDTVRAEAQVAALREFRRELIAHQLESYGIVLPDIHEVVDDLAESADRIARVAEGTSAGIETADAPDCDTHNLVQHRDMKPPWCNKCGRDASGQMQRKEQDDG